MSSDSAETVSAEEGDDQLSPTEKKIVWAGSIAATAAAAGVAFMVYNEEKKLITSKNLQKGGDGTIKTGTATFTHKDLELIRPRIGSSPATASFFYDDFMDVSPGENVEWTKDGVSIAYLVLTFGPIATIILSLFVTKKYYGKSLYKIWHVGLSILLLLASIAFFAVTKSGKSSKSRRKIFAIIIGIPAFLISVPAIIIGIMLGAALFEGTSGPI